MKLTKGPAALVALLLSGVLATGALATAPAAAATVTSSASGLTIVDSDGVTIQSPTPAVEWSSGPHSSNSLSELVPSSASIRNGYDIRITGSTTSASDNGARVDVEKAVLGLRARATVTVAGLQTGCAPDGSSFVSFDSLRVGDVDITSEALAGGPGFTYDLPVDSLGRGAVTQLTVNKQATSSAGTLTTTALQLTDGSEMFEVSRLALGITTCAPHDQAELEPHRVAGVQVTTGAGTRLIDPTPVISTPGAASVSTDSVIAEGVRTTANGIAAMTDADGSVRVRVDAFSQTPRPGAYAEYYDSALRVNGLTLTVAPGGASSVDFDESSLALFADGKWLNSSNGYIYSKLDADGDVTLEVKVNERIDNGDGTLTVNGLHYVDHTGVLPEVILAQATVSIDVETPPVVTPTPTPDEPVVADGTWHAYGLKATGASVIAAQPLAVREGTSEKTTSAESIDDGGTGQVAATNVTASSGPKGSRSTVGSLELFTGTAAAISLRNLTASVINGVATVSSDGGTVFGSTVKAGTIAPGTRFELAGGTAVVVLAQTGTDSKGLTTVSGLHFRSDAGLVSDISVAHAAAGKAAAKATAVVTASRSPWTVSKGARPTIRIAVAGRSALPLPSGTVTVSLNGKKFTTVSLKSGAAKVTLPKVTRTTKVTLRYAGSGSYLAATSKQYTVKIRK